MFLQIALCPCHVLLASKFYLVPASCLNVLLCLQSRCRWQLRLSGKIRISNIHFRSILVIFFSLPFHFLLWKYRIFLGLTKCLWQTQKLPRCPFLCHAPAGPALFWWSDGWTRSRQVTLSSLFWSSVNESFVRWVFFIWRPQKFC